MTDTSVNSTAILHFGEKHRAIEVGSIAMIAHDTPLLLESGHRLHNVPLAYQRYGTLNETRSNAILICHALTGDQYVASDNPVSGKPGWWQHMVGPGKAIDTDIFCVICINVLGGCCGSYGPKTLDDEGAPLALRFPAVTIADMVTSQRLLLHSLGIERLFAVIGGSMGGMQALQWAIAYPDAVRHVLPMATAARHTAQHIAYHEIGRQAIMGDPDWREGHYHTHGTFPRKGLAVARMTAHVTYLSESALEHKFGRDLQAEKAASRPEFSFAANFQVESYLRHQGRNFVERFDPNSYLYITKAADYFDLAHACNGDLAKAFAPCLATFCVMSFSTDWLYPTAESRAMVTALQRAGKEVSFTEIISPHGHDAFLTDNAEMQHVVGQYIHAKAQQDGVI